MVVFQLGRQPACLLARPLSRCDASDAGKREEEPGISIAAASFTEPPAADPNRAGGYRLNTPFKLFNDAHGHIERDQCLNRIAGAIRGAQRRGDDVIRRFGGEEVVVLMLDADLAVGRLIAERMRLAIQTLAIPHHGLGWNQLVTASFGVAADFTTHSSSGELIEAADRALYAAKDAGRDRVRTTADEVPVNRDGDTRDEIRKARSAC